MKFLRQRWTWIAGIVALVALVLAARKLPVIEWLETVADPLRDMGWLGVAVFALVYFLAGMFCLPCAPLTLAGGYIFGTVQGLIAVHTGCVLAAAGGFLLGRFLGRRQAAEWLRNSRRYQHLDDAIAQAGWKIVGLLRLQAVPFGLSNYLYGMTRIGFWHYLLATAVAMLPSHLIYVHLAAVSGEHLSGRDELSPLELIAPLLALVSLIVVTVVLTRLVKKHVGLEMAPEVGTDGGRAGESGREAPES